MALLKDINLRVPIQFVGVVKEGKREREERKREREEKKRKGKKKREEEKKGGKEEKEGVSHIEQT